MPWRTPPSPDIWNQDIRVTIYRDTEIRIPRHFNLTSRYPKNLKLKIFQCKYDDGANNIPATELSRWSRG